MCKPTELEKISRRNWGMGICCCVFNLHRWSNRVAWFLFDDVIVTIGWLRSRRFTWRFWIGWNNRCTWKSRITWSKRRHGKDIILKPIVMPFKISKRGINYLPSRPNSKYSDDCKSFQSTQPTWHQLHDCLTTAFKVWTSYYLSLTIK